jgi:hypothetical protein
LKGTPGLPINLRTQNDEYFARILRMSMDTEPNKQPGATEGEKQGNKEIPPPNIVNPPTPPSERPAEEKQKEKKGVFEKWKYEIEFAGLLGLIFYCYVNWREWQTFDSERVTMESEFKASQVAISNEQYIAESQLREMQKATIIDERAWLGIVHYEVESNISGHPTGISFEPEIRNTGKTPALNVIIGQTAVHDRKAIPRFDQTPPSDLPYIGSIPAGDSVIGALSSVGIIHDNFDIRKESPFYLYGTVWYDDVFGGHHWTQYRVQVVQGITNLWFLDIQNGNSCDNADENGKN